MANVLELLNKIGHESPAPVYLFCPGKSNPRAKMLTFEPFLAERAAERLIDTLLDPGLKDMAFGAFHADESAPGDIAIEAQTLPFLAERRVLLVRNAERYNTESAAGPLLAYLDSPNESTVLIFIAAKADRRTKFFKACGTAGEIVESPALTERELLPWVRAEAKAQGKSIRDDAARELAGRTGTHLSDVHNALSLLVNFVGPEQSEITAEDVIAACADVAEEEVWALTDAIAASRAGQALGSLRRLTGLGKHPDELIGTINWLLKSAYAVAMNPKSPPISPFVAQKVRPLADKLGPMKLRAAFALCTDTQFMMRKTGVNGALALDLLVVKLAAPLPRRRSA